MRTLVFFLEGRSEEAMLQGVLPRILPPDVHVRYQVFSGKQDLEKNLVRRLRSWQTPNSFFVVLRDQDAGDCRTTKARLLELCNKSGKKSVLIRIACHELESFYLGDLAAVERGLGIENLQRKQQGKKFRNPDALANPAQELYTLTGHLYDKLSGSRDIAPHLHLKDNKSHSFKVLIAGLRNLLPYKAASK
jgi:hypothetical protein